MTMMLSNDLNKLFLSQFDSTAERHNKINDAIELMNKAWENDKAGFVLNDTDTDLAEGFVSWLVIEYVSDSSIYHVMQNGGLKGKTTVSEWGDQVPLEGVRSSSRRHAQGIGVSVQKAGLVTFLKPLLENAISTLLEDRPEKLMEKRESVMLMAAEHIAQSSRFSPRYAFRRNLGPAIKWMHSRLEVSRLRERYPLNVYRFFVYFQPSVTLWSKAWQRLVASQYSERTDISELLLSLSPTTVEDFGDLKTSTRTANEYLVLGKKAQRDNLTVDKLVQELKNTDSPAQGMDITHGMIIAACKNPHAVQAYAHIRSNRLSYPYAEYDIFVIRRQSLDPVNVSAIEAMIGEYLDSDSHPPDSLTQSRTRSSAVFELLEAVPGLELSAQLYLDNHILDGTDRERIEVAKMLRLNLTISGKWKDERRETAIGSDVRDVRPISKATAVYGIEYVSVRGYPESPLNTSDIPVDEQWILEASVSDLRKWPIVAADRETVEYLVSELRPRQIEGSGIDGFLKRLVEKNQHEHIVYNVNDFAAKVILGSLVITTDDIRTIINHVSKNKKIDEFCRAEMITAFDRLTGSESAIDALNYLPILLRDRSHFVVTAALQAINHCIDVLENILPPSTHSQLHARIKRYANKPNLRKYSATYNVSGLKASSANDIANVVFAKLETSKLEE